MRIEWDDIKAPLSRAFAKAKAFLPWVFRVAIVALVLSTPHLVWLLTPARTLEVVVMDKTVPFASYREHAALPWLLHAMKLKNRLGEFMTETSYIGFDPKTRIGKDLDAKALRTADILFIADTYGVYKGDYEKPGDVAALERTPKIYGGVSPDEAAAIEAFAARGGMTLAEFNTFASPTDDATRERLERLFGVRWTHWVARYWPKLEDANEVPRWLYRLYERVAGKKFEIVGPALVFVKDDEDILVMRAGEELGPDVVSQLRTPAGATYGFPERGGFWFWMDVVEATEGEVLFEHTVDATAAGKEALARHGLSPRFPALVRKKDAWYFAGDFVDTAIDLGSPERAGLLSAKRRSAGCGGGGAGDVGFFWGFYAPIAEQLLASRAR